MLIFDDKGIVVTDPDLNAGYLEERSRGIVHRYVVDVAEETHEVVVAEYPETGGKDVEIVVDVKGEGHWETRLETGEAVEFSGTIPDDMPHEMELDDVEQYLLYRPYTDGELAERKRLEEERERERAEAAEREAFLAAAPERIGEVETTQADTDDAMCAMYEANLALQTTMADQDAAICALYETQLGGAE